MLRAGGGSPDYARDTARNDTHRDHGSQSLARETTVADYYCETTPITRQRDHGSQDYLAKPRSHDYASEPRRAGGIVRHLAGDPTAPAAQPLSRASESARRSVLFSIVERPWFQAVPRGKSVVSIRSVTRSEGGRDQHP